MSKSLAAVFLLALASPCSALSFYCDSPREPYCVRDIGAFKKTADRDQCRRDLDVFQAKNKAFVACLNKAAEDAEKEYAAAARKFKERGARSN
jgi:hypothetical protein